MNLPDFADHAKALATKLAGIRYRDYFARHLAHHTIEVCLTGVRRSDPRNQIETVDAQKQFVEAVLAQLLLGSRAIERIGVLPDASPNTITSTPS